MDFKMRVSAVSGGDPLPAPEGAPAPKLSVSLVPFEAGISGLALTLDKTPETVQQFGIDAVVIVSVKAG